MPADLKSDHKISSTPLFGTSQESPPPAWNEPGYVDPDRSIGLDVGEHCWQGYAKKNPPRNERAMSPSWVSEVTNPGEAEPEPDLPPVPTPTEPAPPAPEIQPRPDPGVDAAPWIRMKKQTERNRFSEEPTDQWPG